MATIFTLEKLYAAYQQCLCGKRHTANALQFEYHREQHLYQLLSELQTRTYCVSRHICFVVTNPTPREIFAADFRDRVVHHLLCNEIQSLFERYFSPQSFANRTGKGSHQAVRTLQRAMQCVRREYPAGMYYLKLDIENFFRSIDRATLYTLVATTINRATAESKPAVDAGWRDEVLWLAKTIIFHDPTTNYVYRGDPQKQVLIPSHKSLFHGASGKGLPIGNLTSQFFANVYLDALDHFITGALGISRYVRYVDDFVLLDTDRRRLAACRQLIDDFLWRTRGLRLHPRKAQLQQASKGVDFLGYIVRPNYVLVRQRVVGRLRQKLARFEKTYADCYVWNSTTKAAARAELTQCAASYYGHCSHANTHRLREALEAAVALLIVRTDPPR